MSNLTVSTAVDAFMQTGNQAAMQAALAIDPSSAPTFAGCTVGLGASDAPSYSFTGAPTVGFYSDSEAVYFVGAGGVGQFYINGLRLSGADNDNTIYQAVNSLGLRVADFSSQTIELGDLNIGNAITIGAGANATIQGYSAGVAGDVIGFSSGGIASVTAVSDSAQLPIARVVGNAVVDLGNGGFGTVIPASTYCQIPVTITGAVAGDMICEPSFDENFLAFSTSGVGLMIQGLQISPGEVTVTIVNSDPVNSYTLFYNMYISIVR